MRGLETTKLQTPHELHLRFGVSMRLERHIDHGFPELGGRSPACDRSAVLGWKILIRTEKVDELVRVHNRTRARTIPCADNPRKAWREWKCHECN